MSGIGGSSQMAQGARMRPTMQDRARTHKHPLQRRQFAAIALAFANMLTSQISAAGGMAGETETARTALQALRLAQPNVSLAWIAREMPIKQGDEREHYLEGCRVLECVDGRLIDSPPSG